MNLFDAERPPARSLGAPVPPSDIDLALTSQLVVAWAGERGEERRLGWWRSDLTSEFGGEDLFLRLLPSTWRWATLQGAREAARRVDAELRSRDHQPDRIVSLFSLGFDLDERIDERFMDLKRSGNRPEEALPGLALTHGDWNPAEFWDWVAGHGETHRTPSPAGRRLSESRPATLGEQARRLVAGLAPAAESYPLPHFRRVL